ncbi:hypothetical protein BD626DRAFT_81109 [Schizophyllum amplum]|uniref:Uncharacterized protein n=1 Tax=Schizophyllum amplum TaxID=97359 RepID=A0A550CA33_9AGAR|nr:hypothetical protein BD626DRAFT_81109 [Auriculariopsis ampla]
MTERRHESASSLPNDNSVPRLTSDGSTTVRTNDRTPTCVPQIGGLVNHQDLSVRMPQAAATPGILHSNLPAPVAVVRTSRRHRVLCAIGAFMRHPFSRRASRRASNDVLSSSRRGPSTTLACTAHNVTTQGHDQHAYDLPSRLPPQPSLGVDPEVDSPRQDMESPIRSSRVGESDASLTTPVGVSPAILSGEGASDTCPADLDSTLTTSNGHNPARQPVVPRDDHYRRWEDFRRPGAEAIRRTTCRVTPLRVLYRCHMITLISCLYRRLLELCATARCGTGRPAARCAG